MRYKGSVWQSKRDLEDLLLGLSDFLGAGRQREILVKDPMVRYGTVLLPQQTGIKSNTGDDFF
jgi:hypothetical protein